MWIVQFTKALIKAAGLILALSALALAEDCDTPFQLTATGATVVFNNQSKACYNWQVVYFNSGFSAVSVQFESAPNGSTQNVPGTWVAFAGTTLSGSNPGTATTQSTAFFQGSYPWLRIKLVSSTGTGTITGRITGAPATSAVQLNSPFNPAVSGGTVSTLNALFGKFTVPVNSAFSWVDQGMATETDLTDGFLIQFAKLSASDNMAKRCATLPAAPFTVIMAWVLTYGSPDTSVHTGLVLYNAAGPTDTSEFNDWCPQCATTPAWTKETQCTTALFASCTNNIAVNTHPNAIPVIWERVVDNGTTRVWSTSTDGVNWAAINDSGTPITGANYTNIVPSKACIMLHDNDGNWSATVKVVSYQSCSGSSGVC